MIFMLIYVVGFILCSGALYWMFHKFGVDTKDNAKFASVMISVLSAIWPFTVVLVAWWYFRIYKDIEDDEK